MKKLLFLLFPVLLIGGIVFCLREKAYYEA